MKLRYFTEEWTEWREVGSCTVGYNEAPDEFNFYSILERRCNGSKCEIDLETTYEFCEPINGNWSKWEHEITMAGGGNWEFQMYTHNRTNRYQA